MFQNTNDFYFNQKEPNKSCLLALRDIILKQNATITECLKYKMPCFCFRKKPFCYLWKDKSSNEPYILFVEGKYLHHPELEKGKRSRMKILRVNPTQDLPQDTIKELVNDTLNLYLNGTVKIK